MHQTGRLDRWVGCDREVKRAGPSLAKLCLSMALPIRPRCGRMSQWSCLSTLPGCCFSICASGAGFSLANTCCQLYTAKFTDYLPCRKEALLEEICQESHELVFSDGINQICTFTPCRFSVGGREKRSG